MLLLLAELRLTVLDSAEPDERPGISRAFTKAEHAALTEGDPRPALLLLWGYAPEMAEAFVESRW